MNTYEIIKELSKLKKISIRQLEMQFGYSNGYLAKWATNTPNSDELIKLADYFDVSVDYLLGRTDDPESNAKHEKGPGSDLVGYFRLNTAGFDPDETDKIEDSLIDYTDFLVKKARERKTRENKNKK